MKFNARKIKVVDLTMNVTSLRILLYSNGDHAFLIEGSKIKEIVISVFELQYRNMECFGAKNIT